MFGTNWVLVLIGTWLGLGFGLGVLGLSVLGMGFTRIAKILI